MFLRIWTIGSLGFLQLLRSRIYLNLLVSGLFLVAGALVLDRLSGGESARVLVDMGLGFISLVSAVLATLTAVLSLRREIETQEIHWLWARPISHAELILGRFLTSLALVVATQMILGSVLALLAFVYDGDPLRVWLACIFASFEGAILSAIALFFGVASSSTLSTLFTTTLFILGRLSGILGSLLVAGRFDEPLERLMRIVYWILPHLPAYDLSAWTQGKADFTPIQALSGSVYGACYTAVLLSLAVQRMKSRDLV